MDPNFAYAYTLLGHEYVVTEELEKAMSCYRNAVRIDSRHYIAWWVYEQSILVLSLLLLCKLSIIRKWGVWQGCGL